MIYFLQATDGGPIKIGFTERIEVRIKQLETTYARPLALLKAIPGGRIEEHDIHTRFAHLRLGRTEQFRPGPEIMEFIGRPLLVGADPDAVEAMSTTAVAITIKGNLEWREWVERAARHSRMSVSAFMDYGAILAAKQQGFTENPPER